MTKPLTIDDLRIKLLLADPHLLLERDFIQELITIPDRAFATRGSDGVHFEIDRQIPVYAGKLVDIGDGFLHQIKTFHTDRKLNRHIVILEETGLTIPTDTPLLSHRTAFILPAGHLANFMHGAPIVTSVGRFIMNFLILAYPFGDKIPYLNEVWKSSKIEDQVKDLVINKQISADEFNVYADNLMFIGHSPEFSSPNLTVKALGTGRNVLQRKRELLVQYKDQLDAGDAAAMAQIEAELIALDKDYLKGDEAMNYLLKGKHFDIIRKKLFIADGMIEGFGDTGQYRFVQNSLSEGWTQKDFPTIVNNIRAGAYARSQETQKGGEESKFVLRVFQNTRITDHDCGTTRTFNKTIDAENAAEYIYRNFLQANGQLGTITPEDYKRYIGQTLRFRSPLFCEGKNKGYCYTCMGKLFENLEQKVMASVIQNLTSTFLTASLKKQHSVSVKAINVTSLTPFIM